MSIYEIIAEKAVERFGQNEKGYAAFKNSVKHYENAAKEGYQALCEHFNGAANCTGLSVVSEEICIDTLGYDKTEGAMVLAMMYELNITERQSGLVVL